LERRAERLRSAGLRVTAPRLAILGVLEADRSHPNAEQVLAALRREHPSLSLSTVYKTIEAFLRAGLVRRVATDGSLRVDGVLKEHDHAVCRACARVFDIDRRHFGSADVPERLPQGLAVRGFRIEYDVVCATCRSTS
jgi:Fe2+ or Zn2+ uptake regulation protein